jgi:hypothetical protein
LSAWKCFLPFLLFAAPARAQTFSCADAEAEEQRSQTLREEGRDLDAVRVLEQVVGCERTPRRVGRLGLAEAAAGLWVPAEAHLAESLRARDPWVRRVRRDLGEQLARVREHVGNLEVITNAPRGELRIGVAAVATLPMREPLRVPSGALTSEVVAPGFVRELRRVEVAAGFEQLTRENLALTPEAVAPPPRVEPPPTQVTPVLRRQIPVVRSHRRGLLPVQSAWTEHDRSTPVQRPATHCSAQFASLVQVTVAAPVHSRNGPHMPLP